MMATAVKGFESHSRALIFSLKSPFLPKFLKRKIWKLGGEKFRPSSQEVSCGGSYTVLYVCMIQIFSSTVFEGYLGIRLPLNGPFLCSVARTQHKLTVTYSIDTPLQIFVIIYSTQYESKFTIFRNPSPPLQERQGQND